MWCDSAHGHRLSAFLAQGHSRRVIAANLGQEYRGVVLLAVFAKHSQIGLTRSRRGNAAFNYGIFRGNPIAAEDRRNLEH